MCKTFYGYMRVSTIEQNEARQRIELLRFGVAEEQIYMDKLSGKDFNRPQYQRLRHALQEGDTLVVKSIDRLGRNYEDIQDEWRYLVREKKVDIVILDMPLLDTRNNKDLIGTLISDIVLQLLSYVAQSERENIRQRQAEGIAAARARGAHLGRFPDPIPDAFYPIFEAYTTRAITRRQAAQAMGVSENQFEWMCRKHRKKCTSSTGVNGRPP